VRALRNPGVPFVLAGAALLALGVASKRRRRDPYGLRIQAERLEVVDWNAWLGTKRRRGFGPRAFQRAVSEGATTPDEIVARVFYRMFPDRDWPPPAETDMAKQYHRVVNLVSAALKDDLRPVDAATLFKHGLRVIK